MTINKKKNLILYLWEQNVPCTAAELADVLNVSVRTVKMYVKEINALAASEGCAFLQQGIHCVKN